MASAFWYCLRTPSAISSLIVSSSLISGFISIPLVYVVGIDECFLYTAETSTFLACSALHRFEVFRLAFTNPRNMIIQVISRRSRPFFGNEHPVNFTVNGLVVVAFNDVLKFRFHF